MMSTPLVKIQQPDKDIGWGKLGAIVPLEEQGSEITLNDVKIVDGVEFEISGPFRLVMEENRFDKCVPVNFRSLRPGCDYERVIFRTGQKPRIIRKPSPQNDQSPPAEGKDHD
jgi:hypothetical protein